MFVVSDLEELTGKIAALDPRLIADDDVLEGIRAMELARRFLDAAEGAWLGEADARGTTDIATGHRTAQWLARVAGVSPAGARARLNLANRLRYELPATEKALREGNLCADRAKVMSAAINDRIAAEFREVEADLIAVSDSMTFDTWARHVKLIAYLLDQDGPEPADDVTNNKLRLVSDSEGLKITGNLVGDPALVAKQAIETMADELFHKFKADRDATNGEIEIPARATLLALALTELCRRGLMVDGKGKATRPKVEATLVVNAATPDVVHDADGNPLIRGSKSALMCDLSVWTIILNSLGIPLDMGREIRNANREQRRAMKVRDGGCVFPGCGTRPDHCDAHHVAEWFRDLGTSDVRYMVFLCRHHHMVIHRKGWSISIGDDGWSWITTPAGYSLWCQRHGTIRSGAPPGR